ncbi:MAG: LysM peptidoglycan-binding domain-containing protein [Rhodoluna sp.]|nr:LysM peptidoglycan-binding domain-containing protein [Rhodoluna sp.]MBP6186431.1 LysM peptidoglycan-binding domain-containing protein [Rhodoluna sp.]
MSESGEDKTRGQDPKKVALALATLPISIIGSISPVSDAAAATQQHDSSLDLEEKEQPSLEAAELSQPENTLSKQSTYAVESGDTISGVAKRFGTTTRELLKINNLTEAALLMPGQVLRIFSDAIQPSVVEKTIGPALHQVKTGETLSQIATRYSLKLNTLLALNNLQERSLIFPGQKLSVREVTPAKTTKRIAASDEHVVTNGETLSEIAKLHNLSLASLLKANKLTKTSLIFVGQILEIPAQTNETESPSSITGNEIGKPTSICLFHGFHKIKPGETISKLAAIFGVSSQALLSANNLNWNSTIFIGQKLVIPNIHSALNCPRLTTLTDEMRMNASAIIQIGRELRVGDYAIVIALATAMQESSLRNIAFGDRDSIGLFQQRPSAHWGTRAEIMKIDYSIRAFFGGPTSPTKKDVRGLLDISGWKRMSLTEAAQAVQISAHPSAYAKWEPSAWNWLAELDQLEDN